MDWTAIRHPRRWHYRQVRRRIARRTLSGEGLEIGALHSPFPVPRSVTVRYVDRFSAEQLRAEYPELAELPLVNVDIIDDGERLSTVAEASQSFVIASHFLEHCEDPIGTLIAHLRVLRPGGTLLLALPDRRHGVDRGSAPTALAHIIADHEQGPEGSRAEHYRDWVRLVDVPLGNVTGGDVAAHAAMLEQRRYSIHFHRWTAEEFVAMVRAVIAQYDLGANVTQHRANHHEFLVTVQKLH